MNFPKQLNIGSGKNFRDDFLNIDINDFWEPDIVFDLNNPLPANGKQEFITKRFGKIEIMKNMFDKIIAYDVLEHITNLSVAMKSCLGCEGGS